ESRDLSMVGVGRRAFRRGRRRLLAWISRYKYIGPENRPNDGERSVVQRRSQNPVLVRPHVSAAALRSAGPVAVYGDAAHTEIRRRGQRERRKDRSCVGTEPWNSYRHRGNRQA